MIHARSVWVHVGVQFLFWFENIQTSLILFPLFQIHHHNLRQKKIKINETASIEDFQPPQKLTTNRLL